MGDGKLSNFIFYLRFGLSIKDNKLRRKNARPRKATQTNALSSILFQVNKKAIIIFRIFSGTFILFKRSQ